MSSINDISLVTQVAVFHNKRAFDQLVKKYQSPVRRFFLNQTLGDVQLSDDLAQDTFIKAYTSIASFKGLSGFSTWLYRIAYNVLYDYARSHKMTEDVDTTAMQNRACSHADQELKMDIYNALRILKPDERTCITLQLMDGLSIDKIAEITGIAQGTVKSHLSRGKKVLAIYLKENGYGR
ncbi:MAG: RNA polymerase sigma factor [Prevotellaceae bacterium]|nr:RNA polymerase sigma factor [Prevotella sp.]MDD7258358.1 RNA polymerase sigma factor [Prevotellaceae bacterium]MDY6129916.1 RNA polymerase sigma factor [Prevotella sp.]